MRIHRVYIDGPEQEVTLCPLGDIQWMGDEADIAYDHLVEHIALTLTQPHPLYVGMGDYIDFASPSNREALQQARLYDAARKALGDTATRLTDELVKNVLHSTAGRWAGLVQGHHHFRCTHGQDSDEYLAHLLQALYLEEMGIVVLKWRQGERVVGEVTVGVVHGDGHSAFPWAPLNKLYRFAPHIQADILLMGHHTKKAHTVHDQLIPRTPEGSMDYLSHKPCHLVGTGGWMKGYINGRPTYVSKALLSPVALGQPIIHIRPRFRRDDWDPFITVEA